MKLVLFVCLLATSFIAIADEHQCKGMDTLKIAEKPVTVEIALDERSRRYGLMFRSKLGDNCGMLFVFENNGVRTFTMRNTLIPLDIAFIDENGVIAEILTMQPGVARYPSAVQSRYALEVNEGWFETNNLAVGSTVNFIKDEELLPLSSVAN